MGIDPSLTSTGIVVLRNGELELAEVIKKGKPKLGTIKIVGLINRQINDIIENLKQTGKTPDLIVIEGFSYRSKGRSVFDIAYLGWRIREELENLKYCYRIPWLEIPPSQLKKFATGKGNSCKDIVLQQVYKHWNQEFNDNNIADAYVLAQIGRSYLDDSLNLYAYQREVIKNLKRKKRLEE